jgi:hypothetical protein
MDVGVRSSNDIYDPIRQGGLVTLGVPQNRRRKVVTLSKFHFPDVCLHIVQPPCSWSPNFSPSHRFSTIYLLSYATAHLTNTFKPD